MSISVRCLRATRLACLAGAALAGVVLVRALPIAQPLGWLERGVATLGVAAWRVSCVVYVAAALAFVPGALVTLAAGAIFGLWLVVLASAALAFECELARALAPLSGAAPAC